MASRRTPEQWEAERQKRAAFWKANPGEVYPCQCAECRQLEIPGTRGERDE